MMETYAFKVIAASIEYPKNVTCSVGSLSEYGIPFQN